MHLGPKETFAYRAGSKRGIVMRIFVPDDFLDCFLTAAAPSDVHIEIAPSADEGPTIRLTLGDVLAALGYPPRKGGGPGGDIVPGKGGGRA